MRSEYEHVMISSKCINLRTVNSAAKDMFISLQFSAFVASSAFGASSVNNHSLFPDN